MPVVPPAPLPAEWSRLFPPPRLGGGCFVGTVCAAILTYNRKELLAHCLASLLRQSDPPEHILVLDNASTDGTGEFLAAHGFLAEERVEHVRLPENLGPAGGFAEMFRRVRDSGWSWGWFMDDDVVAAPDALGELKRAFAGNFRRPEEVGFLTACAVTPDGKANCVPSVDDRLRDGACAEWGDFLAAGLVRIRISSLNAVLIPRSTIAAFGTPSPDFWAWGEDTEWSLRVTEHLPAFIVGRSRIVHVRGTSGELDVVTEPDEERIDRFFYLYRNTVYLRRAYWPAHGVALFFGKAALAALRCLAAAPDRRLRRAWRVIAGTLAGVLFRPRLAEALSPATAPGTHHRPAAYGR